MRLIPPLFFYLALFGVSMASPVGANCRLVVTQDAPYLESLDLGANGKTRGDILFGEAVIRIGGRPAGQLDLMLTTVDVPNPLSAGRELFEDRFGTLIFRFSDQDTLVVSGSTILPAGERLIQADIPQIRAVTGGTGRFKFVRGEAVTTRRQDLSYEHAFELDGKPSVCRFKGL